MEKSKINVVFYYIRNHWKHCVLSFFENNLINFGNLPQKPIVHRWKNRNLERIPHVRLARGHMADFHSNDHPFSWGDFFRAFLHSPSSSSTIIVLVIIVNERIIRALLNMTLLTHAATIALRRTHLRTRLFADFCLKRESLRVGCPI